MARISRAFFNTLMDNPGPKELQFGVVSLGQFDVTPALGFAESSRSLGAGHAEVSDQGKLIIAQMNFDSRESVCHN